jgi:hypothetical protein
VDGGVDRSKTVLEASMSSSIPSVRDPYERSISLLDQNGDRVLRVEDGEIGKIASKEMDTNGDALSRAMSWRLTARASKRSSPMPGSRSIRAQTSSAMRTSNEDVTGGSLDGSVHGGDNTGA